MKCINMDCDKRVLVHDMGLCAECFTLVYPFHYKFGSMIVDTPRDATSSEPIVNNVVNLMEYKEKRYAKTKTNG